MRIPSQDEFDELELVILTFPQNRVWFRCVSSRFTEQPLAPYHANGRWNSPSRLAEPAFRGTYVAETFEGMWLETAGRKASTRYRIVDPIADRDRWVLEARNRADMPVADLTGMGMARAGLDKAIAGTRDYRITQELALRFYRHPAAPVGILYRCRANESLISLFVFDRYEGGWSVEARGGMKGERYHEDYARCIERYRMGPAPA